MGRTMIVMLGAAAVVAGCAAGDGVRRRSPRDVADRHRERIEQGVDEGTLTPGEARDLRGQQRDIRDVRRDAKDGDGRIDRGERREIRREQKKASEDIWQQKNDDAGD